MFRKKKEKILGSFFHKRDFKFLRKKIAKLEGYFFYIKKTQKKILFIIKILHFTRLSVFFLTVLFHFYLFHSVNLNPKVTTENNWCIVSKLIFFYNLYQVKKTFFIVRQKICLDKNFLNKIFFEKKKSYLLAYKKCKKKNNNLIFCIFSKVKKVRKIKLLFYKNTWIKFLFFYMINVRCKFIKKHDKCKEICKLPESRVLVRQYLNFGVYNMKIIIYKTYCPFVIQARFLAMILATYEIKKLFHTVVLLIKRYKLSSFYSKKLLICLELITGNGISKNIYTKFFKNELFFLNINFKKIPTKIEKICSRLFSKKGFLNIKITVISFFSRFGMTDLVRKLFQKIIFSPAYRDCSRLLRYENLFKIYNVTKKFDFILFLSSISYIEKNLQELSCIIKKNLKHKKWKFFISLVKFSVENKSSLIYKIKLKL